MHTRPYVACNKENWYFKYNRIRQRISITANKLVENKVFSKFHRGEPTNSIECSPSEILTENSFDSLVSLSLKSTINRVFKFYSFWMPIKQQRLKRYNFQLDWKRKRFAGDVQKIIVNNGSVISKTFLTPKGIFVKINRNELGLLVNLFS